MAEEKGSSPSVSPSAHVSSAANKGSKEALLGFWAGSSGRGSGNAPSLTGPFWPPGYTAHWPIDTTVQYISAFCVACAHNEEHNRMACRKMDSESAARKKK